MRYQIPLLILLLASAAQAQSPINSLSAMQPSKGTLLVHEMIYERQLDAASASLHRELNQLTALTQISFGATGKLSFQLDIPLVWNSYENASIPGGASSDDDFGLGDLRLLAKYRIWQSDTSPTNTMRFSAIAGLQIPGDVSMYLDSSSDGFNPIFGGVFSLVHDRFGLNFDALMEFNTDGDDADDAHTLRYDASALYRLAPNAYTADTSHAAWYAVLEFNGTAETNGDHELFISPGIMWEARRTTIDLTLMIPIVQDLQSRPESDFLVGLGIRIPF